MTDKKTFILYTAGDYQHTPSTGGTRRYREMIEYLIEAGDEVYLLAPANIQLRDHVNLHRIAIKPYKSRFLPNGLVNYLLNRKAFREAKKLNYDEVLIFSVSYAIQCVLAGLKNINLFIREDPLQGIAFRKGRKGNFSRLFLRIQLKMVHLIERYTLKKSLRIIVQTNHAYRTLRERNPGIAEDLEEKTYVLFNNVNASWMLREAYPIRQQPVGRGDTVHLVFVGSINTALKGLDILLEAVSNLLDKYLPVRLDVIGDGQMKEEYASIYKNYRQIQFLGHVEEPLRILAGYDLLVVPSRADAFPNILLEGLFVQIPVIGARAGGIPEILYYPELLFDPEATSLTGKLEEIINADLLEKYRQLCIERKTNLTFNWGQKLRYIVGE